MTEIMAEWSSSTSSFQTMHTSLVCSTIQYYHLIKYSVCNMSVLRVYGRNIYKEFDHVE